MKGGFPMKLGENDMLIHEVAEVFGNSTSAIREWAIRGVIRCKRASNGYRVFDREEVYEVYNKFNGEGRGNA